MSAEREPYLSTSNGSLGILSSSTDLEGSLSDSSFSYSTDEIGDYYTRKEPTKTTLLNLNEIIKSQGKLFYFIFNEVNNHNPLIHEYTFTEEEKTQYCNVDKFMYEGNLYNFKMYTLEVPFTYYKEVTY